MGDKIGRVGLLANSGKLSSRTLVQNAARLIQRSGRKLFCDAATAQLAGLKCAALATTPALADKVDLLLVFGGDGTMLRVARDLAGSPTPILGVKVGGLGFLTTVQAPQLASALKQLWAGDYMIESRPLIQAIGQRAGENHFGTRIE